MTTLDRAAIERIRDEYGGEPYVTLDGQPYVQAAPRTVVRDLATTALALLDERDDLKRIHDVECAVLDKVIRERDEAKRA